MNVAAGAVCGWWGCTSRVLDPQLERQLVLGL